MNPPSLNRMSDVPSIMKEPTCILVSVAGASRRRPEGRVVSQIGPPKAAKRMSLQRIVVRPKPKGNGLKTFRTCGSAFRNTSIHTVLDREQKPRTRAICLHPNSRRRITSAVPAQATTRSRGQRSVIAAKSVQPNTSLKRSTNGMPPGPGHRYGVHCPWPGPGGMPLVPA